MQLVYVEEDQAFLESRGSRTLFWLDDIGAIPLHETTVETEGFLFSCAHSQSAYQQQIADRPLLRDTFDARAPLLSLGRTLDVLQQANVDVPMPETWRIELDEAIPSDISFPLFVRTDKTSWKHGGEISRVRNEREFADEAAALRRALGWDATIIAREWIDFETAGSHMYGAIPQEVRVWCVDSRPIGWSFHHMHIVDDPAGFPISATVASTLKDLAARIAAAFESRLIVCDFAKRKDGSWVFLEAGPGSCAGTGHEHVFKAAALALVGQEHEFTDDCFGGRLT